MIHHYAQDISRWKNWQKEYRYGVILIIPTDPPRRQIDYLRTKYDPSSQAICGAHISLTTALTKEMTQTDWEALKNIAAGIASFKISYGPLTNFLPAPGIVLAIEPKKKLNTIRAVLESAAVFKGAPPREYPFVPHMTIAEFITEEETKKLMIKLKDTIPQGDFICTYLSYIVPDENFHFSERGRLALS